MNGNDIRPFLVHLRAEHRLIRGAVAELEEALARHVESVSHCTSDLHAALQRHFCEEEQDGCADEAVARNPTLAHEATELCHEHEDILRHMDRLAQIADPQRWRRSFAHLKSDIESHLDREAHLLETGFNADQEVESFD